MPIIGNSQLNNIAFGSNYSRKGIYARLEKSFIEASYRNSYIKEEVVIKHYTLIIRLSIQAYHQRDEIKFGTKFTNSNLFFFWKIVVTKRHKR